MEICENHTLCRITNGKQTKKKTISILKRGAYMLEDKTQMTLYFMECLTADYEKKLACITKELIKKDCQHENVLTAEKQRIIFVLDLLYKAIEEIQKLEGVKI